MCSFINFFLFSVPKCQLPEAVIVFPEGKIACQGKITLHVSFLWYNPLAEVRCCESDLAYVLLCSTFTVTGRTEVYFDTETCYLYPFC